MVDHGQRQRGRPRDPEVETAIVDAAGELLAENGYAHFRVQDVADRAGVGLGAVYRRWPSKRMLALSALRAAVPDQDLPRSPDPQADLLSALTAIADALQGPRGRLLAGVVSELANDPELADAVRNHVLGPVRRDHREHLRRILGDVADLDLRADLGPALILFRSTVLGRPVSRAQLRMILEIVTAPSAGPSQKISSIGDL